MTAVPLGTIVVHLYIYNINMLTKEIILYIKYVIVHSNVWKES